MRNTNYYTRQNHKKAVTYLKAGLYCDRREKQLVYFVVTCSIFFCLMGIIFSALPTIFSQSSDDFKKACTVAVESVGIASGIFLVVQLLLRSVTENLKIESVNAIERFDNYVYDLSLNRMIARPMTEAQLDDYASKIKSEEGSYNNPYFACDTENDPLEIYNNQREICVNEYHLMLYVKRYLNMAWILFAVLIVGLALSVGQWADFITTLQKIFFPSLSIISLIVSNIIGYNKALKFLQNILLQYEAAEKDPNLDKRSELTLRQNQDAIFHYRMMAVTVPLFLIVRYEKSAQKTFRDALKESDANSPKTSPFLTAELTRKLAFKKEPAKTKKSTGTQKQALNKEPAVIAEPAPAANKSVKPIQESAPAANKSAKPKTTKPKAPEPEAAPQAAPVKSEPKPKTAKSTKKNS